MTTWLFTSTTYGTWLPGDPRGSVTRVLDFCIEQPGARASGYESDL